MSLLGPDGDRYALINGNNREHYALVGKVDAIITDPPYGAETHRKERAFRRPEGFLADVPVPFDMLTPEDMSGLTEFASENCESWMLTFCQTEHLRAWQDQTTKGGIRYVSPMIWVKPDAKPNFSGAGPGVGHETIATFWCGKRNGQNWNGGGKVGVFYHTRGRRHGTRHPTEKPVSLMKELVRLFTNPDDVVFDPFMGSGSTGVAALELGRRFIGIEKNPEYFQEAQRRIHEAVIPEMIFEANPKMKPLFGDTEFPGRRHNERLRKAAQEKANAVTPRDA